MVILMVAAVGALFAVWIVTGVRLVLLARRTRGAPELMLGGALLLQSGIGYPSSVVAPYAGDLLPVFWFIASVALACGMTLLFAFTARVFHDHTRWSWIVVGAAATLCAIQGGGNFLGQITGDEADRLAAIRTWAPLSLLLSGSSWGWAGYEALRFHAQLRKRVKLGLADPVVANRMLLWGLMGSIAVTCVIGAGLLLFVAGEVGRTTLLPTFTATCGLLVSLCMILAFWPPPAYLALVRRSAPTH